MKRLFLLSVLALLVSACGDVPDNAGMPGELFIRCVENAAAHGSTAHEAKQACDGWR